jgi:hypothetical protein
MPHDKGRHPGTVGASPIFSVILRATDLGQPLPTCRGASLEAVRAQWADSFIDGCKAAKVAAIAITDHHDATFVLYVQKAAEVRGF